MPEKRPRLLYVVAHEISAEHLLRGQLAYMRKAGFDVAVAVSPGPGLEEIQRREGVRVFPVSIVREIAPMADLRSLWALYRLMRRWKPHIVNASTPKAGLLGMLAARVARVPGRIYVLRGLRLETATGLLRLLLVWSERIAAACASSILCISESLMDRAVDLRLVGASRARVLAKGSSNGIDVDRFDRPEAEHVQAFRRSLGLTSDLPVVGFVGRLTRDKGIAELIEAFQKLKQTLPDARLLLVGEFERGDPVGEAVVRRIEQDSSIILTGYVRDPAPMYKLMDVLAFPSHREGFGNVCLEAAAAGLPVVGFKVTGVVDAVVDGTTGVLVPESDTDAMADALEAYLRDARRRSTHGRAAQERVRSCFAQPLIWNQLRDEYEQILSAATRTAGRGNDLAKRGLDIVVSSAALVFLSPLLLCVYLAVRFKLGKPVLFRQKRPGLHGRPFTLYKFRTMLRADEAAGSPLSDEERLTRFGRTLRATSLDELPELWNVLRGDMSLVGPRPLLMEYLDRYTPLQARRHEVVPGLTGWAQINGRNAVSWDRKFEMDVWYVDNRSLQLDLRIMLLTLLRLMRREGVTAERHATMPLFEGSERRQEPDT